jgi:hypothetical protein
MGQREIEEGRLVGDVGDVRAREADGEGRQVRDVGDVQGGRQRKGGDVMILVVWDMINIVDGVNGQGMQVDGREMEGQEIGVLVGREKGKLVC